MEDTSQPPCQCQMCEMEAAGLDADAYVAAVADRVREDGWAVQTVREDRQEPPWAYSVGLWHSYHSPELAVFGLPLPSMAGILDTLGHYIASGARFEAGDEIDGVCPCTLTLRPADPGWTQRRLFAISDAVHGLLRPPFLQVVWPDRDGRWPWDSGFAASLHGLQPLLWLPPDDNPPSAWTRIDEAG